MIKLMVCEVCILRLFVKGFEGLRKKRVPNLFQHANGGKIHSHEICINFVCTQIEAILIATLGTYRWDEWVVIVGVLVLIEALRNQGTPTGQMGTEARYAVPGSLVYLSRFGDS
jgi:hypothetical protein